MRIRDWSSDVGSSDLLLRSVRPSSGGVYLDEYDFMGCVRKQLNPSELLRCQERVIKAAGPVESNKVEEQIGRASCRERVCQYVYISVLAGPVKKQADYNQCTYTTLIESNNTTH